MTKMKGNGVQRALTLTHTLIATVGGIVSSIVTGVYFSFWLGRTMVLKAEMPELIRAYSTYTEDGPLIKNTINDTKRELGEMRISIASVKEKTDIMSSKVDDIREQMKEIRDMIHLQKK